MRLLSCFALALATLSAPLAQPAEVFVNGLFYTVNPEQPTAEAMAVRDGRIAAIGSVEEVVGAFPDAAVTDLGGGTVVPGLIDAHAHLMSMGQSKLTVDLVGAASKAEVLDRLRAFAADLPEGEWLLGRGWDQNDWPAEGGQHPFPTAADLDAAFPERPVWLGRIDGHAGWANTAAMRAAGVAADTPDPEGGRLLRDAAGRPSGVFIDAAEKLVEDAVPEYTNDDLRRALRRALRETTRHGLTGVHDAGVKLNEVFLYQEAIKAGRFPIRVYAMIGGPGEALDHFCEEGPLSDPTGRLDVRSIKLYADGALGSRGAALLEPYTDEHASHGLLIRSPDSLQAVVSRAMGCGLQVNTHAIGDRAVRLVLDTYAAAVAETGGGTGRHRIEHAQVVAPEDFPRFAELGVIASVQPTHATSDMPWAETRLGPERIGGAYAWRQLLDAGARLALGSDFPVERVPPLLGFYAAVTRQDAAGQPPGGWRPAERLTREEALRGFTLDAAYAAFMEDLVGSLEWGKRADFVVLSQDIMTVPADQILATEVLATFLDGQLVYRAD